MKAPPGKGAWTVKVGEKGQFVIPKEARDMFDIRPGDTLIVLADIEQGIALPPKSKVDQLIDMLMGGKLPDEPQEPADGGPES